MDGITFLTTNIYKSEKLTDLYLKTIINIYSIKSNINVNIIKLFKLILKKYIVNMLIKAQTTIKITELRPIGVFIDTSHKIPAIKL